MRFSGNVIEETLVAYVLDRQEATNELARRIRRVADHYVPLLDRCPLAGHVGMGRTGFALWSRRQEATNWPPWAEDVDRAIASVGTMSGWRRVVGGVQPSAGAALDLAEALIARPVDAARLNPPTSVAVADKRSGAIVIATDFLGVGRLYELRFPGGTVWSNRLGALPLFAGTNPAEDVRAWAVLAAGGWFLGELTPIEGATKLPAGELVQVTSAGLVKHRGSDTLGRLVSPRRARLSTSAAAAAEEAMELIDDLAASSREPLRIALTGGRDSRLSAAAALAANVPAIFNTGDHVAGEVETVRTLIEAAPKRMEHEVFAPEPEIAGDTDLIERVRNIHLVHDAMRNPQELRRETEIPFTAPNGFSLSGHGGELGHGFYYHNMKQVRRLRRGGRAGLIEHLERSARRKHSAASAEAYDEYLIQCDKALSAAEAHDIGGPMRLDFFYLAQRLAYRSGLGARSGRASVCATPGFVRAAFDLSPSQRVATQLHRRMIATLVPEWSRIPFFSPVATAMPQIKRKRLWERAGEAKSFEEILASPECWREVFDVKAVRGMWSEVRAGRGSADYEHVFDRIVWKAGFDQHLRRVRDESST